MNILNGSQLVILINIKHVVRDQKFYFLITVLSMSSIIEISNNPTRREGTQEFTVRCIYFARVYIADSYGHYVDLYEQK